MKPLREFAWISDFRMRGCTVNKYTTLTAVGGDNLTAEALHHTVLGTFEFWLLDRCVDGSIPMSVLDTQAALRIGLWALIGGAYHRRYQSWGHLVHVIPAIDQRSAWDKGRGHEEEPSDQPLLCDFFRVSAPGRFGAYLQTCRNRHVRQIQDVFGIFHESTWLYLLDPAVSLLTWDPSSEGLSPRYSSNQ